jgi:hypothetical protein
MRIKHLKQVLLVQLANNEHMSIMCRDKRHMINTRSKHHVYLHRRDYVSLFLLLLRLVSIEEHRLQQQYQTQLRVRYEQVQTSIDHINATR